MAHGNSIVSLNDEERKLEAKLVRIFFDFIMLSELCDVSVSFRKRISVMP